MRTVKNIPPWLLMPLVGAVAFGVGSPIVSGTDGGLAGMLVRALPWAAIGAGLGVISIFNERSDERRERRRIGPLPAEDGHAAARRAAAGGPVPADPQLRDAAARLAALRLDDAVESRFSARIAAAFLAVFAVVLGLTASPWCWLGLPAGAALLAGAEWQVRRLSRLHTRLQPATEP